MRRAASFAHSFATGFWIALISCLPQQELSAYSEGAEASGAPALEPGESAGEQPPGSEALGSPESAPAAAGTPAEPGDTPANTDGPAPPDLLAQAEEPVPEQGTPAASTDAPTEPDPAVSPPASSEAPITVNPTITTEPGMAPVPLVGDSAAAQFRFVRLVADSEFNGGPLSAAAEFDVFGADGQVLDRTGWVASADSAEPVFVGGAPAALAIDGQAPVSGIPPGSSWRRRPRIPTSCRWISDRPAT
ncbi:MAG: hypothetical protein RL033_7690 [Pseudomonadota bacterium]|jgi:hypothetical protein